MTVSHKRLHFFCLACLLCTLNIYSIEKPSVYLLRAPRSGSHWFFYCVSTLFGKNIVLDGTHRMQDLSLKKNGDIITAHNPYDLRLNRQGHENDLLILLIRNYRECMLRDYGTAENVKREILCQAAYNDFKLRSGWVFNLRKNHYFHNLRVYELWNPDKRLIIYYEDLLANPKKVLHELAPFIGEQNKKNEIDEFVGNLEEHLGKSLAIYEMTYKSHSKGRSLLYHTEKIGENEAHKIDLLVKKHFPYFLRKYLSRYPIKAKNS